MRIGLLGGSFNPAHEGHLHITRLALKKLGLDRVWWLVSPQNPLKDAKDMAPLQKRIESACKIAQDPRIDVRDLESDFGTTYTVDALKCLTARFARMKFVWIMGADSFGELQRWKHPHLIMQSVPIAVFARPGFNLKALNSQMAQRYASFRLSPDDGAALSLQKPPAWIFFPGSQHSLSATAIRQRRHIS